MRESPEFKFDEKQLKTEQHWMYWRKETYGLRTPKRFKITNYGPAIEGKAFSKLLLSQYSADHRPSIVRKFPNRKMAVRWYKTESIPRRFTEDSS